MQAMTKPSRLILFFWAVASAFLSLHLWRQARALDVWATSRRWQSAVALGAFVTAVLLVVWYRALRANLPRLDVLRSVARRTRWGGALWAGVYPFALFLLARHPVYGTYFADIPSRLALLWMGAALGAVWLQAGWPRQSLGGMLAGVLAYQAAAYALAWYLPTSTYPLSLGWSETSRYYYASLFFSPRLYGFRAPWPALHPSRYLLQSVPFLFHAPLWAHRTWQNFLWILSSLLSGWAVTLRLRLDSRWTRWTFFWGAVLFLLQAPVYYHLAVMVILVVWGVDVRRPKRTLAVVLAASLWAGISRVNWFPVPAMLAALLYLLETPQDETPWWRYLAQPALWGVLGVSAALLSQAVYAALSGNPPQDFGTSFTSDLLWYRLLPNPTFPQGLLPMALLVSLPVWVLLVWGVRRVRLSAWRILGLTGLTAALFLGGLVVSVKIGGGNNLHNLDAYLTALLLWGGYTFWDRLAPERESAPASLQGARPPWGLVPLLMILPLYWALSRGGPRPFRDLSLARETVNAVRRMAEAEAARGGEVLFISERHLLTFGEVDVPLVPEYERTFLMEMAMAHNEPYLRQFRDDLAARRFALIVVQPLNLTLKGRESMFGEENDAWVRGVAAPLLCYYEPVQVWRKAHVQVMRPREAGEECGRQNGE